MDAIVGDYVVGHLRDSVAPGAIPRPGVGEVVPTVFVMDGDVSVRHALEPLIRTAGWQAKSFASAEDFLGRYHDSARAA